MTVAKVRRSQRMPKLGAYIPKAPTATATMIAVRIGAATRAMVHLVRQRLAPRYPPRDPDLPAGPEVAGGVAERSVDRRVDDGGGEEPGENGDERHVEGAEPQGGVRREGAVAHHAEGDGVGELVGEDRVRAHGARALRGQLGADLLEICSSAGVRTPAARLTPRLPRRLFSSSWTGAVGGVPAGAG